MSASLDSITFSYTSEDLFSDFSIYFDEGSFTVILGPSGCGKTTLLHFLAGLRTPTKGKISSPVFDNDVALHASTILGDPKTIPRRTSCVFQEPRLFPWRTVSENVRIPLRNLYSESETKDRVGCFLTLVGLEGKEHAYPAELSGGQKQRASLARAFAFPSSLVLMDEPFQSLDLPLRIQLMDVTLNLLKAEPRTVIAVTHDPREAIYLGDRVVVLGGKPVTVILDRPVDLSRADRSYTSSASASLEALLFSSLVNQA
jgi:NitT/TauT family transport system ATP-binding protein